jgi:hypothetical protein
MDNESFIQHLNVVTDKARINSSSPEEFINNCKGCGLRITYPETFINIYYYKKFSRRKRLKGGLMQYVE